MLVNVTPIIPNTTMQKYVNDLGVEVVYYIRPVDGYVLHDQKRDWVEVDEATEEETVMLGYTRGTASVGINYDFVTNPRELYTVLESEVPADQIFGGGNNDHEIM